MVRVTVDGRPIEAEPGQSILRALDRAGIELPRLCDDARVAPAAVCRLCLVEVEGLPRAVPACATPVQDGMRILTRTDRLEAGRRNTLALLARNVPRDPDAADTAFVRLLRAYGLEDALGGAPDPGRVDAEHPYVRFDPARCVLCFRCVRVCDEVQDRHVWSVLGRGASTRVVPGDGATLARSACVACGTCVDACPSGALEDETVHRLGAPDAWTRTTCPYCGVGCELRVGTRDGRIVTIRPEPDAPVNRGHLCSKGRYAFSFLTAPDRPTAPMIREGGRLRPVSWDEAERFVAARLREALARHGPGAVGVLASARGTNEEAYVAQKLARVVLRTNDVDCCARVCHAPSAAAMGATLGTGAATNGYDDLERARTLLVVGANPTESHPVLGARILRAARNGAALVVIDPRRTDVARRADVHLALRPGTNVPLLNALANVILTEGLADEGFLADRVDGVDAFRAFVAAWPPERAAAICGVDPALVREAARRYARDRPAMSVHGLGLTEHVQGTDAVTCLVNLALLTGNLGRPGAGVNPLRGQNNVQGAAHMGCEPAHLAGWAGLDDGRARFEAAWGAPLPAAPGLDAMAMLDAAREGRFQALWTIGWDVLHTNPDQAATREALGALDLLVVQDPFLTETARAYATVFLPAAASFEKDGTFMNAERRVQRVRRAVPPPPGVRADWEILCGVARAMGHAEGFAWRSAEEIWDEVRAVWPAGAGLAWARLDAGGLQWPCPAADHPGTPILHVGAFPGGRRAPLSRIDWTPSPEAPTPDLPFALVTGRALQHYNAGTRTRRTAHARLRPRDVLGVSAPDARRLGVHDGDPVVVRSRHGEARIAVHVDPAVKPGELFATFHDAATLLNHVTGSQRDGRTGTPEYKLTAVSVEPLTPSRGRAGAGPPS